MAHSKAVRDKALEEVASLVATTGMPAKKAVAMVAARTGVPAGTISRWYWPVTGAMNARRAKAKSQGSGPSVTPYDLIGQQLDQGRSPEDIRAAFLAELARQSKERGHQLATTPAPTQEDEMHIDDLEARISEELENCTIAEQTVDEIRASPSPDAWVSVLKKIRFMATFGEKMREEGLTPARAGYDLAQLAKAVSEQGFRAAL